MNQSNTDESGPSVKRMKPNDEKNSPDECGAVVVDERLPDILNRERHVSDIFKLTIDCFEEVFDYLSLEDLAAMGQTCTRMQRIAGHCFQKNYGAAPISFDDSNFYLFNVNIDCFSSFFQNVQFDFDTNDDAVLEDAANTQILGFTTQLKDVTSIKIIEISDLDFAMEEADEMKAIIGKAEHVVLDNCYNHDDLSFCSNIKFLSICDDLQNVDQWTHQIFPNLEELEIMGSEMGEIPVLKAFLEQNTTIKQLSITMSLLRLNRAIFKNLNAKFDTLVIKYSPSIEFDLACHLLNELHESGLYKKLHFYFLYGVEQTSINQLASVKGLVKFHVAFGSSLNLHFGSLESIEELYVRRSVSITDLNSLPYNCRKLKRIEFGIASSDDILPFICHAKTVNKIKVSSLKNGSYFDEDKNILNLLALNKERKKLYGARKIMIYVQENVYLATKWAMRQTEFSLIEMKRHTSYNWKHSFCY